MNEVLKALQYDMDQQCFVEIEINPERIALEGYIASFLGQPDCNSLNIVVICGGTAQWDASILFDMVRRNWGKLRTDPLCITIREPVKEENTSCDYADTNIPSKCIAAYISDATDKASAERSFWQCITCVLLRLKGCHKDDQNKDIEGKAFRDALYSVMLKSVPVFVQMKGEKQSESSISDKFDKLCQEVKQLPQTFIVMYLPECAFEWFQHSKDCSIRQINYVFLVCDPSEGLKDYPDIKKELEDKKLEIMNRYPSNTKNLELIDIKDLELIEKEESYHSSSGFHRTTENREKTPGGQMGTTTKATNSTNENMDHHHESKEKSKQTEGRDLEKEPNHSNMYEDDMQKANEISDDGQERI